LTIKRLERRVELRLDLIGALDQDHVARALALGQWRESRPLAEVRSDSHTITLPRDSPAIEASRCAAAAGAADQADLVQAVQHAQRAFGLEAAALDHVAQRMAVVDERQHLAFVGVELDLLGALGEALVGARAIATATSRRRLRRRRGGAGGRA
jgi:hypothetical protein